MWCKLVSCWCTECMPAPVLLELLTSGQLADQEVVFQTAGDGDQLRAHRSAPAL